MRCRPCLFIAAKASVEEDRLEVPGRVKNPPTRSGKSSKNCVSVRLVRGNRSCYRQGNSVPEGRDADRNIPVHVLRAFEDTRLCGE
jgi:hypothetical protein